jgi:chitinase
VPVPVTVIGDAAFEGNETFSVEVGGAGCVQLADGSATGIILNDDLPPPPATPNLSIENAAIDEGPDGQDATLVFTVRQSGISSTVTTFEFDMIEGTAKHGSDYVGYSGRATIPVGGTTNSISVTILGDNAQETDEGFTVRLVGAQGATISDGQALGTIRDDDAPPELDPPTLSVDGARANEGGTGAETMLGFTVRLSHATSRPVEVAIATADGSAVSGNDYRGRDVRLVIPAGQTSAVFAVPVLGDRGVEGDEAFTVRLSAPQYATLADAQATGTIADDDAPRTSGPQPREPAPGTTGSSSGVEPIAEACAMRKWARRDVERCASNVSARWNTTYRQLHRFLSGQVR